MHVTSPWTQTYKKKTCWQLSETMYSAETGLDSRPLTVKRLMWKRWNWLHRSLFISSVFSLIVDKLRQPSFSSAVLWFFKDPDGAVSPAPPGPENIHLDSANIQSSNTFLLDISLRKKRGREMYQRWYPLVSDITFIKGVRVCLCVCFNWCYSSEASSPGTEESCPTQ